MFEEIYKNAKHTASEIKDGFLETTIAPAWNAVAWASDKQMHLPVVTMDDKQESVAKIVGEVLGIGAEAAIFYKAGLLHGAKAAVLDKDVEVLTQGKATSTLGRELDGGRFGVPRNLMAGDGATMFDQANYRWVAGRNLHADIKTTQAPPQVDAVDVFHRTRFGLYEAPTAPLAAISLRGQKIGFFNPVLYGRTDRNLLHNITAEGPHYPIK